MTMTATRSRPSASHHIAPILNREWNRMRHSAPLLRRARAWGFVPTEITTLDQVLVCAGHLTPATPATEQTLRSLILLAQTDDLAARIVMQRLLPGLMALVSRRGGRNGDEQILEELVGAAWITIRSFDPARSPSCLAAALIGGAEHRAFKAAARRRSASEIVADPEEFGARTHLEVHSPEEELAEVMALARAGGLSADDDRFVGELIACGSTTVMAARHGVTARTIRNRRAAVVYRLQRSVDPELLR